MAYEDWGFRSAPFATTALPASELGNSLLVGRHKEIRSLKSRILAAPKLATVEGLNGVGKTSVINVAVYQLYKKFVDTRSGPLFIPCKKPFQLDPRIDISEFVNAVMLEVAQTLIDSDEDLKHHGVWFKDNGVASWLNSPHYLSVQAGLFAVQGGYQRATNTSAGFERSGFKKAVLSWLKEIFPTPESGGVVCLIDNLELLQSSSEARAKLELLRDELLTLTGMRWVLSGSLGIVYGVVSSPRLEGFVHQPIEIGEIGAEHVKELLSSRITGYRDLGGNTYLPLTEETFESLYRVLKGNLRSTLSHADTFCQWVMDRTDPATNDEKEKLFLAWLYEHSKNLYDGSKNELRPRALEIFDIACRFGVFSPSEYEFFGSQSLQALRPHIRELESVGLLVSTQDEIDKRRKTIQVTPKGWLVKNYMDRERDMAGSVDL